MCAGLKWQWGISCCCSDLSRQAGQRQTRLQFLRTVWDGRGVCSHEVSNTTGCVCRRAGRGLSGDHRQLGAARSPGSCNPLCRFLGQLCVVLGAFRRLLQALLCSQLAKRWDQPRGCCLGSLWRTTCMLRAPPLSLEHDTQGGDSLTLPSKETPATGRTVKQNMPWPSCGCNFWKGFSIYNPK